MSYEIGDIVEGQVVAETGKYYWVWGRVGEELDAEDFYTHNLAEAKRYARKINKIGCCQIKEYECCFNECGEMIQHLDDETAIFDLINGMSRQVVI